jgi:hypothetical protein
MFEGDFADMCAGKLTLVSMGGRAAEVEKVVQPVNLVDRKYLSNHCLTENIWGKSRYILSILAYHRNLSAKA